MKSVSRRALLALVFLGGCTVEEVDFSGKTCASGDCPEGYVCSATSKTCERIGGSSQDAGLPRDAGLGSDAGVEEVDAGSTLVTCEGDEDCSVLRGHFCGPEKVCVPCDTSERCGEYCVKCNPGWTCDNKLCVACATERFCGPSCVPCTASHPICYQGSVCVECVEPDDCGPGRRCDRFQCLTCNTDALCGADCAPCANPTPYCSGDRCVECTNASHCPTNLPACAGNRCAQCDAAHPCPAGSYCGADNSCGPCTDATHCGPGCQPCAGATPQCNGTSCVECTAPEHCGAARTCVGERYSWRAHLGALDKLLLEST